MGIWAVVPTLISRISREFLSLLFVGYLGGVKFFLLRWHKLVVTIVVVSILFLGVHFW